MKPIAVQPGEKAPDVDDLMEKAKNMEEMLAKNERLMDNSQMKNITGVEEAPMTHYWTNQNQPSEGMESVTNHGASSENVTFIDANPHQTGSALAVHENSAGGDALSGESSARYGAGSTGIKKGPVAVTKGPLDALLGGAKGGPPPGLGDKPPGMDDKPPGMDDMGDDDEDAQSTADRIKSLVDKLADQAGGPEKAPLPPPGPPGAGAPPPPGLPGMGGAMGGAKPPGPPM